MSPQRSRIAHLRSLAALPVLVAVLAASACSDSDSDSSADTTTAPTAAPETTAATSETTAPTSDTTAAEAELWTGTAPNMTPVDDETAAEWQALTETALAAAEGTPGAIVAISHPDLGFWSTAVGEAEVDTDPMTLEHHSRIGSITKTFTGVAILQLVDEGTLSLDATVADIVPEIAEQFPETADVTVEQLVSMTSGLPDYANVPGSATAQAIEDPTKVWTPEDLIAAALEASEVQPIGTPGYSTTNFAILGRMYEAVTGDTIEAGITKVAEEAGLTDTALLPGDQNEMPDPSTHGYVDPAGVKDLKELAGVDLEAGTDTTDWSLSWGGAGGGAYSTIDDLFLWASTAAGNTLLSTELGTQRLQADVLLQDAGAAYGLGIMQQVDGWYGHTGQAIGWEALAMHNPETGATMAVLVNSTGGLGAFYSLWNQVFDLGLGTPELVPGDTTATTAPSDGGSDTTDGGDATDTTDSTDAGAADDGPSGTALMTIGDLALEAEIVECTLVEPDVTFLAQGETVQFEVFMLEDASGEAGVTVSGSLEFEGSGEVVFESDEGIDQGTVTIVGTGAAPDESAPVEDFTIAATIEAC
jgi:D-alanyl-D-alanine carboxypeptidase